MREATGLSSIAASVIEVPMQKEGTETEKAEKATGKPILEV